MGNLMNTLLLDQRRIEDRRTPPQPLVSRAERIIAAGHARRTAYRCQHPNADTAMVYGAQIGYLHGEVTRLCNESEALTFERDETLLYFKVACIELGCDVWAGVLYEADNGVDGEYSELVESWANGVDIAPVLLERVAGQILQSAVNALHAQQAKDREGGFDAPQ